MKNFMKIDSEETVQDQVRSLRRKLRFAYLAIAFVIISQFSFIFVGRSHAGESINDNAGKILKAKGLIIVDEKGRERILIGSPIPQALNRVRTDPKRVKEQWAIGFPDPDQYMRWYRDYDNSANGIVILDENGFDRIALGDVPDPNIGKRIGPSTGIAINDEKGFERGGFSLLRVQGKNRVVLGLDTNRGVEGIALGVIDGGGIGMSIFDETRKQTAFLGNAPAKHWYTNLDEPFSGLLVRDAKETKYKLSFLGKER